MFNSNMSSYTLSLQQQIQKLKSTLPQKEAIIDVLRDTSRKFPFVEQIDVSRAITAGKPLNIKSFSDFDWSGLLYKKDVYVGILDEVSKLAYDDLPYIPWRDSAVSLLYNSSTQFYDDYKLHEKNGHELTVAKLLDVIGYAKNTLEIMGVKVDEKVTLTLIGLNSIDLALNNQKQDKPFNKALKLSVDFLGYLTQKSTDDERAGRLIAGTSIMIDLAIDFLVKE